MPRDAGSATNHRFLAATIIFHGKHAELRDATNLTALGKTVKSRLFSALAEPIDIAGAQRCETWRNRFS